MAELHKNERKTLLALKDLEGKGKIEKIAERSGMADAAVMRTTLSLASKKLVKIIEKKQTIAKLTSEGRYHAQISLPERRLIKSLIKLGGQAPVNDIVREASLDEHFINIALGWIHRKRWASIDKGQMIKETAGEPDVGADERLLSILNTEGQLVVGELSKELQNAVSILKRRKLLEIDEQTTRNIEITESGKRLIYKGIEAVEKISQLTPKLIKSGDWREVKLRRYEIKAPVAAVWPGKKQPYKRFLDELKWKLVALGFKEMTGPTVELMFFNCDALYMPQDHPAREIHDIYFIEQPSHGDLTDYKTYLKNVEQCHENGWKTGSKGWGEKFSLEEARRLVLRSQGTALSARMLINPDLEIPGKYFSLSRCYRPDVVDRTHLPEFNQVEGIVVGEDLTIRDLLGILKMFAIEIAGADKVRFKPDYFPFTEPSVELSAYKEGYGWGPEFGGAGIFRPEVNCPLEIDVPVIAWGLGVDRIYMMKAGITDIRDLFTQDLDRLRRQRVV